MTAMALYIRTSTTDQDGQAQTHALARAAEARGWQAPRQFIDLGHSGSKASRPALDALKRSVRAGETREVMVFALDRLGRSLRDLLLLLGHQLEGEHRPDDANGQAARADDRGPGRVREVDYHREGQVGHRQGAGHRQDQERQGRGSAPARC